MTRASVVLVLAASLLARAAADTNPVQIAVGVLDGQGRAVTGLSARDFQLREDGVAQAITSVAARHPAPRRIAILLDEFHVGASYTNDVRTAVGRFVTDALRPDDAIVVLKPLDPLTQITLSTDHAAAERAIATFDGRQGNYEPRSPLEQDTMGRAPALVEASRSQVVLSGLRALAAQLGSSDGRSAILMVSEGFVPARPPATRGLPDVGIVERFANKYDVPVFGIDPAGPDSGADDRAHPQILLAALSHATGGTVAAGGDILAALTRAAADLDGGYMLTFASAHGEDGQYHAIDVSVTRRTPAPLAVLARAGYISPISAAMRRTLLAEVDDTPLRLRPLHRSPWIEVWSGVTGVTDGHERVAITWAPQARVPVHGTTIASTAARVTLQAKTPDGQVLFDGALSPVRPGEIEDATLADRAEFDAPAGTIELNMTVFGSGGAKLDDDIRDVEVPSVASASPVLMSPIIIGTWSAKEFNEVAERADARPNPSREFSRMERLLIRVPAYAGGQPIGVTGRLLNALGQPMRAIAASTLPSPTAAVQFDLPLAPFTPGEYYLLFSATHAGKTVEQRVDVRVTM